MRSYGIHFSPKSQKKEDHWKTATGDTIASAIACLVEMLGPDDLGRPLWVNVFVCEGGHFDKGGKFVECLSNFNRSDDRVVPLLRDPLLIPGADGSSEGAEGGTNEQG